MVWNMILKLILVMARSLPATRFTIQNTSHFCAPQPRGKELVSDNCIYLSFFGFPPCKFSPYSTYPEIAILRKYQSISSPLSNHHHEDQHINPNTLCSVFSSSIGLIITILSSTSCSGGAIGETGNLFGCPSRRRPMADWCQWVTKRHSDGS
jgi:hypothetical protein